MADDGGAPLVTGLVLAAGQGRRFGGPKALAATADGTPWLHLAVAALRSGGCAGVVVALGAGADAARALVPEGAGVVVVPDFARGLSASLRAGLPIALDGDGGGRADAVVVVTVDTPSLPPSAVRRVLGSGIDAAPEPRAALARATYHGAPGHPVLIGRDHVPGVLVEADGDAGARGYLTAHDTLAVECGDLWDGVDVDT
ncbi:nucleotidyltransferase family protein [Litorihabitans aurantiacus]|uniref:Molybdopterin-guanine dinucleotide biosynthesis protein MobA n=1 Tax=Litorihabitans aurantiacus TaxID=1930061 RepID=A0AA37UGD9_9MICO|nr:NTP transferase domain-containing protein [Litorihabitans aurantiacus]GMA30138.1 molybdopterin-guanine dinucleotide biosynthesis protein MobA [Litorihabitans aurantiacus]